MGRTLTALENSFNHLKAANLKIKVSKCQCFKRKLHYHRDLISEQDIQPLLNKVIAIKKPIRA